jgi:inhibitor of cysteine peptidase
MLKKRKPAETSHISNILMALLAVLILAIGCGTKEIKLDANDNGRQIELEKGQILVVTLESNPTTGYRWEVVEPQESILQQKGEAEFKQSDPRNPPPPGTGGTETFRFEAVGAGQMTLKLVYHRPWEEGVDPLETFSLQVTIR